MQWFARFIFAALVMAGFSSTASSLAAQNAPADCGADALKNKIGLPVTGSTAADVRVGGEPVPSKGIVRVIAPGQSVTQDYSDGRLNLETDAQGNLIRATCG